MFGKFKFIVHPHTKIFFDFSYLQRIGLVNIILPRCSECTTVESVESCLFVCPSVVRPSVKPLDCDKTEQDAQLSQGDRAAVWVSFGQSGRLELGDNIILRTLWLWHNRPVKLTNLVKKRKIRAITSFKVIQNSSRSVPIESPYATSY